jgi:uncharacterized protein with von Willebrand factor type A (vWA) domain
VAVGEGQVPYAGAPVSGAFRYSRWDGSQQGFDLDADSLLSQMTDDLLYHGDIEAALRRMLQQGFTDRDGREIAGLRELLERLRQARREEQERYDLGGVYDDIARELEEVVAMERAEIDRLEEEAQASGDERRSQVTEEVGAERRMQLELMPRDLPGRVQALSDYDFTSSEARERFEELLERLRRELTQSYLDRMAGAMASAGPEEREHLRAALDALNRMIEQRAAGDELDPSFEDFMSRYGDIFAGNPQNLDELLEQLAARMAAASAMLASMTPEQRAQLQSLMDQLLGDMDLAWQLNRLGDNLRMAMPEAGWDRRYQMSGTDPLGLAQATDLFERLGDLDQLEQMLRGAPSPGALAEVDIERAAQLLGPDAAASLEQLAELARRLEKAGLIEQREGRLELTPRGIRRIGRNALSELFARLSRDRVGRHEIARTGLGAERAEETKQYEYGDPFDLDIERTIRNAIVRRSAEWSDPVAGGAAGSPRPGGADVARLPVRLQPEDFEVERTEDLTRTATVLMIDLSLSMPMRDNFLAAKKVAMALQSLISTQFPRDYLGLVGFSEVAREIEAHELPEVSWDFVYGTNMQHAFLLARRMLARQSGTKQIIMITDGEPTAHLLDGGVPFFNYPPVRATVDATLTEVARCTKAAIRINTFMIGDTVHLREFVEQMTRLNRGRAFFTTPETLGDYVLVDFIDQKRAQSGGGRSSHRRRTGRRGA